MKSALSKLLKNEFLIHTVNLDLGHAFSKGPEFAFSEGPGPGHMDIVNISQEGLSLILEQGALHCSR